MIALVLRRLTEPMEIGGRLLPAGVNVAPCIYLMHRRPDVYDEPRAFRPERFLEQPPGTYTWIPFGGGVRRCLGASFAQFEIKVVLRELVARLEIRPARPQPERRVRRAIVFAPSRGGELVVERRAGVSGSTEGAGRAVPQRFQSLRVKTCGSGRARRAASALIAGRAFSFALTRRPPSRPRAAWPFSRSSP